MKPTKLVRGMQPVRVCRYTYVSLVTHRACTRVIALLQWLEPSVPGVGGSSRLVYQAERLPILWLTIYLVDCAKGESNPSSLFSAGARM